MSEQETTDELVTRMVITESNLFKEMKSELNQRIATLESDLAATKRECEGLRLQIREARECARCEHPKPTDGFAPWTDCGHCVGCQCKSALAARDATEGGK